MRKTIAIIGGGASALALATALDENKFDITIYERHATLGRKFLVAGDGGFNLTHSEEMGQFITRYTSESSNLLNSLRAFTNIDTRSWLKSMGIETFVGSSKRVFPVKSIKPIQVLNAILTTLKNKNIHLKTRHTWQGWTAQNELLMSHNEQNMVVKADVVVFSLGGASWRKTGSDGLWSHFFAEKGIEIVPFQASNCAYRVAWSDAFLAQAEGKSLKNIALKCGDKSQKGELVITKFGLEGGAIYALSPAIRQQLKTLNTANVHLDLKPVLSELEIKTKILQINIRSITQLLKDQLHLSDVAIALLKSHLNKSEFTDREILVEKLKNLPLSLGVLTDSITAAAPIDEAISTVGGIAHDELDDYFQLKKMPQHYAIGEMIDWDAPTGGYLLQACFSMGHYLAQRLNSSTQ